MKALTTIAAALTAAAACAATSHAAPATGGMTPAGLAAYGQTLQAEAAAYKHARARLGRRS